MSFGDKAPHRGFLCHGITHLSEHRSCDVARLVERCGFIHRLLVVGCVFNPLWKMQTHVFTDDSHWKQFIHRLMCSFIKMGIFYKHQWSDQNVTTCCRNPMVGPDKIPGGIRFVTPFYTFLASLWPWGNHFSGSCVIYFWAYRVYWKLYQSTQTPRRALSDCGNTMDWVCINIDKLWILSSDQFRKNPIRIHFLTAQCLRLFSNLPPGRQTRLGGLSSHPSWELFKEWAT